MIGNWLEMAGSAKDAGNNEEAETYCNKILEVDPDNYKALMLKGEVVAWQSRSNDSRVDEGVSYFIKGIQSAPEDEKKELIEYAKDQISRLCFGMIKLQADRFAKWPDKDQLAAVKSQLVASLNTVVNFLSGTGAVVDTNDIMSRAATAVKQTPSLRRTTMSSSRTTTATRTTRTTGPTSSSGSALSRGRTFA